MIRVLIADDELPARGELKYIISQIPDVEIVGSCTNGREVIQFLKTHPIVDLLFLDIKMPVMNGLEAAKVINRMKMPVRIVFATGFSQFALEAFDLEAFDYIMKPYNGERIARTLQRFRDSQQLLSQEEKEGEIVASPEFISLKTKGRTVRLSPQKDIFLIATEKTDSPLFYTREGIIRSFMTLREAEKTLTPLGFFRTHKGFIVNLSKIHEIQPQDNGTLLLTMTRFDKLKVPVSRHYIKPFKEVLHI